MHSFYYQNRILMYVAMTILIIIFALIFASNAASSIETSLDVINSENNEEVRIVYISIPQGSSATDITAILDNNCLLYTSPSPRDRG